MTNPTNPRDYPEAPRNIAWFSCGAASAVAAYLVPESQLVYCDTGGEHPDNMRFLADVEVWLSKKVTILRNEKYKDHMDVIRRERYVNGPHGARCTVELKKVQRFRYQQADDIQIFGYTAEESDRAKRFLESYPEVNAKFPLIEHGIVKEECLGIIHKANIALPKMYLLGFNNNNCIGCVKGGMGYWNHVRKHFPDAFDRMALIEREVGNSCIKGVFLDELDPSRGHALKEMSMNCDFVCPSAEKENP